MFVVNDISSQGELPSPLYIHPGRRECMQTEPAPALRFAIFIASLVSASGTQSKYYRNSSQLCPSLLSE